MVPNHKAISNLRKIAKLNISTIGFYVLWCSKKKNCNLNKVGEIFHVKNQACSG